jgi:autotransporter passenger strand-loop-strand repeat protein
MSQIIVSGGTTSVTTVDASNTYLVESGGQLDILNGGLVSGLITVDQCGTLIVSSGGTTLSAMISSLGYQIVYGDGTVSDTTVLNGGTLELLGGPITSGVITISSGGVEEIGDGPTLSGFTVSGTLEITSGGTAIDTTVLNGRHAGASE